MVAFATAEIDFHSGCGVVTKEIIGKSARGLLNYIGNPKKTGDSKPFHTNFSSGSSPRDISREFSVLRKLKPNLERAVAHIIVSVPEIGDDPVLWRRVVDETLKSKGYGDCLFASFVHRDTDHRHAHIFVSRIYINPKTGNTEIVSDSKNYQKNRESSRRLEKLLGVTPLAERPIEARPYTSSTKHKAERRESRVLPEKSDSTTQPERKTVESKYSEIAEHAAKSLETAEDPSQWKNEFERRLADSGLVGTVEFHHRGEEISGWSLALPGGSSVKGSSISRALGFGKIQKQLLANAEEARARRRRLARAGETMDASIALAATLARPSAKSPLGQLAQPLADAGLPIAGFKMVRQEAEAGAYFQYHDESGAVAFQDTPNAGGILIFGRDDAAVQAAVKLAVQRHGSVLECAGAALQDPEFRRRLVLAACVAGAQIQPLEKEIAEHRQALAQAAEAKRKAAPVPAEPALGFLDLPGAAGAAANDEDDGVDPAAGAASGGVAAAGGGQGEGAFITEAPQDLGASHEADVARLDALDALGLSVPRGGEDGRVPVPAIPDRRDVEGRLARARSVKALAEILTPLPTEQQAARMSAAELGGVELLWSQLRPVAEWASVTAERHQAEASLGRATPQQIALARAEADARVAGSPLVTEVTRLAAAEVRARLDAAKAEFAGMGLLERTAEAVSGRRAAEISALEDQSQRAQAASVRSRREFEQSEAGKLAAAGVARRQEVYWAEREALNAGFVGHLAHSLAQILARLARWVEAAVRRESKDGDARRRREQLVEEARLQAGGAGAEGHGDGDRRERQR